jgi:hypothetical protein
MIAGGMLVRGGELEKASIQRIICLIQFNEKSSRSGISY